jgi:hypothetical protein
MSRERTCPTCNGRGVLGDVQEVAGVPGDPGDFDHPGQTSCGADGGGWRCCRPLGHGGRHVAALTAPLRTMDSRAVAEWEGDSPGAVTVHPRVAR